MVQVSKAVPIDGRHGTGRIQIARVGKRSVVSQLRAHAPLKLFTPRNHGHAAWVVSSSLGGGLLGGDNLSVDVGLEAGTMAWLTTQASTKVYRSEKRSQQQLRGAVDEGALLVSAPDPLVCYRDADFAQELAFDVNPLGNLIVVEGLCSGRATRGERWAFRRYESRVRIRRAGVPFFDDVVLLDGAHGSIARRMDNVDAMMMIVLCGPQLAAPAQVILDAIDRRPLRERIAASPLLESSGAIAGMVIRIAGTSIDQVSSTMREQLGFVRAMLGDDVWSRRW